MSFHCNHCGKKIDQHVERADDDHDLIPWMMVAEVTNNDGTFGTVDDRETGGSFYFKLVAVDENIEEHYHRVCALWRFKEAAEKELAKLALMGRFPHD